MVYIDIYDDDEGRVSDGLIISLDVGAEEHGGTAAKDVNTGTLLFKQGSALASEAITFTALSLQSGVAISISNTFVVFLLHLICHLCLY